MCIEHTLLRTSDGETLTETPLHSNPQTCRGVGPVNCGGKKDGNGNSKRVHFESGLDLERRIKYESCVTGRNKSLLLEWMVETLQTQSTLLIHAPLQSVTIRAKPTVQYSS